MGINSTRTSERKRGRSKLENLMLHRSRIRIIHYSCESFNNTSKRAPRVTSISIYDFDSKQIESFSIHLSAQEKGQSSAHLTEEEIDILEKDLLQKFYRYIKANKSCLWVHWKMKDVTYGFKALEVRAKGLKIRPTKIQELVKYDLADILKLLYSSYYESDGNASKLLALARRNGHRLKNALTGLEEAQAFEQRNLQVLHTSTQQKVEGIAFILEAAAQDNLKVAARLDQIYGLSPAELIQIIKEHPIYSLVTIIIGTIVPICNSQIQLIEILLKGVPLLKVIKILFLILN